MPFRTTPGAAAPAATSQRRRGGCSARSVATGQQMRRQEGQAARAPPLPPLPALQARQRGLWQQLRRCWRPGKVGVKGTGGSSSEIRGFAPRRLDWGACLLEQGCALPADSARCWCRPPVSCAHNAWCVPAGSLRTPEVVLGHGGAARQAPAPSPSSVQILEMQVCGPGAVGWLLESTCTLPVEEGGSHAHNARKRVVTTPPEGAHSQP
jgi:hypothetical protein